jgi:IS5 family transposase
VFEQTATRKTQTPKLYSWHAPEVVCMSKGKARTPYEFGSKVGIAATLRGNLIVGARAFDGNPYDGHTLSEQIEQATILMQDTGVRPNTAWVDLGYRGVDAENPQIQIKHRGKKTRLTELELKTLKRRQAIEPVIGHLKADHRLGRCHLKGELGDKIHAVLCAAGYNIRWLLRMIRAKGLRAFLRLLRAMAAIAVCGEQRLSVGPKLARMRLSHRHVPTPYTLAVG